MRHGQLMRMMAVTLVLFTVTGCAMVDAGALRAKAADDLACPSERLRGRGLAKSGGGILVDGCGKYAVYGPTSAGWRLRSIGEGPPPSTIPLAAGRAF